MDHEKTQARLTIPEDLFREVHAVLAQIPYGQIQPLMVKLATQVKHLEDQDDGNER